jgi:sulfur-carrier protein
MQQKERMKKTIQIEYFAMLREQRGVSSEKLETEAGTLSQLYKELEQRHALKFPRQKLKAAVNDEIVAWETPVREGTRISFIPPVSGG